MIRYATAAAFKQAVETRLRSSSSSGTDFARRRQLLVFDRLLARLTREFGDSVMLKGGLVVELRVQRARTTKDIDLRLVGPPRELLERLRHAAQLELGDFMVFTVAAHAEHPEITNEGWSTRGSVIASIVRWRANHMASHSGSTSPSPTPSSASRTSW